MHAALSVGANLGDREAALAHVRRVVRADPGLTELTASSLYETEPMGGVAQPAFLNAVLVVTPAAAVDAEPLARRLLALARRCESDLARVRDVRWGPRTLDVDVLAVGSLCLTDADLTVPHPRLAERAFVLVPWAEVDPEFAVPGLGRVAELLAALSPADRAGVRRHGPWPPAD